MYSSIALVTGKAKSVLLESGEHKVTDMSFCLITTFERILRDEFTTAAQVSSAEDSIARTLKQRLVGGSKANNLEKKCFEDDCIDMSLIAIDTFIVFRGRRLYRLSPRTQYVASLDCRPHSASSPFTRTAAVRDPVRQNEYFW